MEKITVYAAVEPEEIVVSKDAVYVASNITPYEKTVEDQTMSGYQYDCEIYTKDEYLIKLTRENEKLKEDILDTQMALIELYEGGEEE